MLARAADKLTLFSTFADMELEMEPIEEAILDGAAELEHAIEMEAEAARGK